MARGAQATPTPAAPSWLTQHATSANNRAASLGSMLDSAQAMGQRAASPLGVTDQYNVTTRGGVATPGTQMSAGSGAIDAAYAARHANHVMPTIGAGLDGVTPMHAQGMTLDRMFSPGDTHRREKFEAAKARKADQKAKALSMRQQRAQYRNAVGYNNGAGTYAPMFNEAGKLDLMATAAARNIDRNPALSMAAIEKRQTLDRLAEQAAYDREMDGKRFSLDELVQTAGLDHENRKLDELEAQGRFNRNEQSSMSPQEILATTMKTREVFANNPEARTTYVDALPDTDDPTALQAAMQAGGLTPEDIQAEYDALNHPGFFGAFGNSFDGKAEAQARKRRMDRLRRQLNALGRDAAPPATTPEGTYEGFNTAGVM
ncbi:hypothetical protein [Rhodopirellula sallentina]|nr:hypothetical protein [Rhodopirellula sallentina]